MLTTSPNTQQNITEVSPVKEIEVGNVIKQLDLKDFLGSMREVEPSVTIRLPSIGKMEYSEIIKMKKMQTKHQKVISSTPQFSRLPVLVDLLSDRLQDVKGYPVDILRLTKDDFNFILFLYQISLDTTSSFIITCANCEKPNNVKINIESDLDKSGFDTENNYIVTTAWDGKVELKFNVLRVLDMLNIYEDVLKSQSKLNTIQMKLHEMAYSLEYATLIETDTKIELNSTLEKLALLDEINSDEIEKVKSEYDKMKHGLDLSYKFVCKECEHEEEIELPMNTDFNFFNLDEVENMENILESQFLLSKAAGIDLTSSDILDYKTRKILIKIIDDFYENLANARNK